MDYLFKNEKTRKFFDILSKLGRGQEKIYNGKCQKEVFVQRTINKYFKGRNFIIIEDGKTGWFEHSENTNSLGREITLKRKSYYKVNSIRFKLGYSPSDLEIYLYDACNHTQLINDKVYNFNEIYNLVGKEITVEEFNTVLKLFIYDEPMKRFTFKKFSYNAKKKKYLPTPFTIDAKNIESAIKLAEKMNEGDAVIISTNDYKEELL